MNHTFISFRCGQWCSKSWQHEREGKLNATLDTSFALCKGIQVVLGFEIPAGGFQILDLDSWILDPDSWILDPDSWILDPDSWIPDSNLSGSAKMDLRFHRNLWILDIPYNGFRIPNPRICWILDSFTSGTSCKLSTKPIDLFGLYILFSQYRSCDNSLEAWSFNEQNKRPNLLSIITWSVLGKQNVQAEKVYYTQYSSYSKSWWQLVYRLDHLCLKMLQCGWVEIALI